MQQRFSTWLGIFLSGCLLAGFPSRAADTPGDKWTSLFNGKDLTGWVPVHDVTFEVREGNLRLVKGMGWLRTGKPYSDFILECEWRALVDKYDSGIFIRAGLDGQPWPTHGWQVNLRYDALGGLVHGSNPVVPAETPKMPVNQWVKFRIEVRGKTIALSVNGEETWTYDKLDTDRGYIGIEAENFAFDFRNLRIQELPSTAPATAK
jgi:hypothetical protein